MNVFDLFAKIGLDTSEYDAGLDSATEKGEGFASKVGKGLKTVGKVGVATFAAIGTATATATASMVKGAADVAAYGDNIDKMSQKMGMTAEAYQEWDAVMQHSGTSMESMQASMKTLANAVETGNDAFEQLGLSQEELASMSQQDIFEATIKGLQNVKDDTQRTYLAGKLLGRGATELGALLNTSAEDTDKMRQRVHELGGVMSDEAVKASAQFQDNMQDLKTAFSGIKNSIMSDMLPSLNSVTEGFTKLLAGEEGADEQIAAGIDGLVSNVIDGVGRVIEIGGTIIPAIVNALVENLPKLFEMGAQVLGSLASGIIDTLPSLLQTGLDIIVELAQGIIDSIPEMAKTAVDIIKGFATFISENLPMLIDTAIDLIFALVDALTDPENLINLLDAAIEIILALAKGIMDALPKLIAKMPEIIVNIVTALIKAAPKLLEAAVELIATLIKGIVGEYKAIFKAGADLIVKFIEAIKSALSKVVSIGKDIIGAVKDGIKKKIDDAKNWGKDLIANFVDGIKQKWNALKEGVANVANTVKDFLGFSEPKKGPLSNFHTYAPDMMDLFIQGIKENTSKLQNSVARAFDFGDMISTEAPNVNLTPAVAGAGVNNYTINMNVYGAQGQDVRELAKLVSNELGTVIRRREEVW